MSDHAAADTVPDGDESRRPFLIAATAGPGAVGAGLTAVPVLASGTPSESARAAGLPTDVALTTSFGPARLEKFVVHMDEVAEDLVTPIDSFKVASPATPAPSPAPMPVAA